MADPFLTNLADSSQLHGAVGQTTISMSGLTDTSVQITGQAGINANAIVRAWLVPVDGVTGHSADEAAIDGPRITAGNVVGGVGFTIWAVRDDVDTDSWVVQWEWKN